MLDDEIRQLLRELAAELGADRVAIVHAPGAGSAEDGAAPGAPECLGTPLGQGAYLHIEGIGGGRGDLDDDRERRAIVERGVRALRACRRRWQVDRLPALSAAAPTAPGTDQVRDRIESFLQALANSENAVRTAVTVRGKVVAASAPLAENHRDRIPFTLRRVRAEASRHHDTSHAEIVDEDCYAASFWFDACLIAFFTAPYAVDFVRHRAKLVMRELVHLLPILDAPPPPAPAKIAPIPE